MCIEMKPDIIVGLYRDLVVGIKEFNIVNGAVEAPYIKRNGYKFEMHDLGVAISATLSKQPVLGKALAVTDNGDQVWVTVINLMESLGIHIFPLKTGKATTLTHYRLKVGVYNKGLYMACYVLAERDNIQLIGEDSIIVESIVLPNPGLQHHLVRSFHKEAPKESFYKEYEEVYSHTKGMLKS